ncbi:MAG: glycoside hydrolase family 55 protein [Phycisphaeraceae bacterium]
MYDPLTGQSQPFDPAVALGGDRPGEATWPEQWPSLDLPDAATGFTLELFVRNDALPAPPGHATAAPVLRYTTDQATDDAVALQVYASPRPHAYHWWAGAVTQDQQTRRMTRNQYNGWTHVRDPQWRHLAIVYNHDTRTVTTWLDYTKLETIELERPLRFGQGALRLADVEGEQTFHGHVTPPRLTTEPLEPWHFQRATPHDLNDVSFKPTDGPLPQASGYVDLRLRYGAVGDGVHDDTAAIQRAFNELQNRVPTAYETLYFPPGTYLISKPLTWTRFLVVQGAGVDKTVLRLKNDAEGFGDAGAPDALLYTGWDQWRNRTGKGNAGNVIGNYLFDLTIDTGTGNPGAVALSFHANNHGAIENVTIRSGDGTGHRGLDFSTNWPGPTLMKNLRIDGFDTGIYARAGEYSLVFENIELANQQQIAISNNGNVLSIRNLRSDNAVPVIETGGWGMVILLDSQLHAPEELDQPAITNASDGALFVRNVEASGYPVVIRDGDREVRDAHVEHYLAGEPQSLFDAPARSLNLPIESTPTIPLNDADIEWVDVRDFADHVDQGDWAPAIQAAIDSGAEALLFPANFQARVRQPVDMRGSVRYVLGMKSTIGPHKGYEGPVMRLAGRDDSTVIFERLDMARRGDSAAVEHVTGQRAVFRHGGPELYQGREGAGDVLAENVSTLWRLATGQRLWGRQLNPESHDISEIINDGGDMWILGLKTEYASTHVENRNAGRLEVLGGFLYPVTQVPPDMPLVLNGDAAMSMIFSTSAYTHDHRIYFRDTQNDVTRELVNREIDSKGPRRHVHLYTSSPLPSSSP